MTVDAYPWFQRYAFFRVPFYESDPVATPSSSGHRSGYPERLHQTQVPRTAVYDSSKVNRLLGAARQALQTRHLVNPGVNDQDTDIKRAYAELFSPAVETKYGVMYDMWKQIDSERGCQSLTQNALLYAIRFVVKKMFNHELTSYSKPLNPGNILESKERVDFSVENEDDQCLYLVENKTPLVLNRFEEHIRHEVSLDITLQPEGLVGEKVLNKSVFYMCIYNCDHLVLSSFEKVFFFERIWHNPANEYILSYSDAILQNQSSKVFLALLGLTLSQLDEVSLDDSPDLGYDTRGFLTFRQSGGPGPSGGTSAKQHREISALQDSSPMDYKITDIPPRSASWQEKTLTKDTSSIINILGGEFFRYGKQEELKFELVPGVKFPSFPTSDEAPVLKIVEYLGTGATGVVCKAELLHPDNCEDAPSYVVKLVDSDWRCPHEYRNVVKDLHQEYVNYCILELGKQCLGLESMIRRCTATCYGLYRLRNPPYTSPKFVLIMEYCGDRVKSWTELGNDDKSAVMDSLVCLHMLGLAHNDIIERNVVFDNKTGTYKFIDLCTSTWHECNTIRPSAGKRPCKELQIIWDNLFPENVDSQLEPQVAVSYRKPPVFHKGYHLRSFLEEGEKLDVEKLATSVSQLAEELDPEM